MGIDKTTDLADYMLNTTRNTCALASTACAYTEHLRIHMLIDDFARRGRCTHHCPVNIDRPCSICSVGMDLGKLTVQPIFWDQTKHAWGVHQHTQGLFQII